MSRRVRPLVIVLLLLIILLVFGIFRARSTESFVGGELPSTASSTDLTYAVYRDPETGLYGVRDSTGRVRIAPEWEMLNSVSADRYIAGGRIGRTMLYGMIDLEEKLIIPQVCRSINSLGYGVLAAELAADGTYLFYNRSGALIFPDSWDTYTLTGKTLRLFDTQRYLTGTLVSDDIAVSAVRLTVPMLNRRLSLSLEEDVLAEIQGYSAAEDALTVSAVYLGAMLRDDYAAAYPLIRSDAYREAVHSGLFAGCSLQDLTATGCSVFADTESGYRLDFTVTYTRVITPSVGEIPAVTETCARDLTLELTQSAEGNPVLRRVIYSEEYDSDLPKGETENEESSSHHGQ